MAGICQATLSNVLTYENDCNLIQFSVLLRVQLTICQLWFRFWVGAEQAPSHYLNNSGLFHWRIYSSLDLNDTMTSSNGNIIRVTGHCPGNSPVTGEFPAQRPVTRSFDVFFDLRLNIRLSKQWWGWWFETPSRPFWRYCIEYLQTMIPDDRWV